MAAYLNVEDNVPLVIKNALQDAMEHAVSNIPAFAGKVYVFPDASGSMSSAVTGNRGSVTSKVTCRHVAALFAAAILRQNSTAEVLPFGDNVCSVKLNPRDSIVTNTQHLARVNGGGTNCAAPLVYLNKMNAKGDLCVFVSDNESWRQSAPSTMRYGGYGAATGVMHEWEIFKKRNPNAKLVCIDVQPVATTQAPDRKDILNVGGFSDSVFDVIKSFSESQGDTHWTDLIEKVEI
jgi:60 kDa SS-A/Ro ribonucleoprotein